MRNFYIDQDNYLVQRYVKIKNINKDIEVWVTDRDWQIINSIQQGKADNQNYEFTEIFILKNEKNDLRLRYNRAIAMKLRVIYEKVD